MNRGFAVIASSLVMIVAFTTAHAAKDQKASTFVLCKNQKNVRSIRILPDGTQKNCTITYSKGSEEEVVGENSSMTGCKSILKNIQANLESSKWNCKTFEKASVTTSSEVITQ